MCASTSLCQFQSSYHSTLPLYLSVWGFVTKPTQRSEIILFLLYYYLFKIFHRFWLSPFPSLNPHNQHTVTIFGSRCRQYPIDGMLLLDLHYSSHLTQTHSINVKYMKYLWLKKVLNRRGKLWTRFRHVKAGSRKITHIDHVERTITLFTIYALLLSIRRIDFSNFADQLRMRSTLIMETQLLSNEKFRNKESQRMFP